MGGTPRPHRHRLPVAGRRLGTGLYTSTMAAVVLGGASTVGGVGLGYQYGISGMWLVVAIAVGLGVLSLFFAARNQSLKVFTVSQMLQLRYGAKGGATASSFVMLAYTIMIAVTSTAAYAAIFSVLFPISRPWAILLGGAVVIAYSVLGAMWSMGVGVVATVAGMMVFGVLANAPIYMGLIASAVVFVAVSLMSRPTPSDVSQEWNRRIQESKA